MYQAEARERGVIKPVQYLRGLAAMMVVWHHIPAQHENIARWVPQGFGGMGVDVFFVISGFVMVLTTHGRDMSPAEFMLRRVIRVAPSYWAVTLLIVALALAAPLLFKATEPSIWHVLQSLLFIPHWSPTHAGKAWPVLVPGWTLNYEMFFYVLFAASLFLRRRWRLMALGIVLCTLAAIGRLAGPFSSAVADTYTDLRLLEFLAGVVLAHAWCSDRWKPSVASGWLLMGLGFALMPVALSAGPARVLIELIAAALVVAGALAPGLLAGSRPMLAAIGDASYVIYLTHLLTLGALRVAWPGLFGPMSQGAALAFAMAGLVSCAAVGWLVFRFIESPVTRLLNARLSRRAGISGRVIVAAPLP